MPDSDFAVDLQKEASSQGDGALFAQDGFYEAFKRVFDLGGALVLVLVTVPTALALVVLNPFFNPGPLIYSQMRMGQHCRPFRVYKFRTMLPVANAKRGAEDGVETHRITPFGRFLRRTRLDELPQIVNVLKGEMSLIGPRPDYFEHACSYVEIVPNYRARHAVRPGITGLAQIEVGYADNLETVRRKVEADLDYIERRSVRVDLGIAIRTVTVILARKGQ